MALKLVTNAATRSPSNRRIARVDSSISSSQTAPKTRVAAWRGQTRAALPPEQCDPVPRLRTGPRRFDVIAFGPRSRVFSNAVLTSCRTVSPREDRATRERASTARALQADTSEV